MDSFSNFARRRDVVRFLLESGYDPAEYDIMAISERWETLKKGLALGALSLTPCLGASCDKKADEPKPAASKPESEKESPSVGSESGKKGVASEAEMQRRAEEYEKTIRNLKKKPWSELTPQERKLLRYSF
jgi:hypothetical protein